MHKKNLSVEDIQQHCGVARSTVYRWLNGNTTPQGEAQLLLMELLRVDREFKVDAGPWNDPLIETNLDGKILLVANWDGKVIYAEPYIHPLWKTTLIDANVFDLVTSLGDDIPAIFDIVKRGHSICIEHCRRRNDTIRVSVGWFHPMKHKKLIKYQESWYEQFSLN